ncbi:hypothetical protein F511_45210 [Dorcoceras hygrometricum]|uniref:Lysozyme n=1 Tax=Dorcoceras hygrometricum TaxID=472368 RepID=A0A2Z6ZWL1_9LAMI|nr:hypothetical protein F511_45210 [Dorcoceras hygrometricum]
MTITQEQAEAMLKADMSKYESYVNNPDYVPVTAQLTQYQFDALVSFCYNCGAGNLQTLCRGRTIPEIARHITAYNKSSGTVLAGLVRRRKAELDLFNKKEEEAMTAAEKTAFDKLVSRVEELEKITRKVPAPKWFVKEFGSEDLGGKISDPSFTLEGWRTLAVGLRVRK